VAGGILKKPDTTRGRCVSPKSVKKAGGNFFLLERGEVTVKISILRLRRRTLQHGGGSNGLKADCPFWVEMRRDR